MSRTAQINETIQLLIKQGQRINQCIIELEQQRNEIINDSQKNNTEIELNLEKVKKQIDSIDKNLTKIRSPYFA